MTRQDVLHNTYHTHCHSIGTYDMVQKDVSSRASFIIVADFYSGQDTHRQRQITGNPRLAQSKLWPTIKNQCQPNLLILLKKSQVADPVTESPTQAISLVLANTPSMWSETMRSQQQGNPSPPSTFGFVY